MPARWSAENHLLKRQINEFDPNHWFSPAAAFTKGDLLEEAAVMCDSVVWGFSGFSNAS